MKSVELTVWEITFIKGITNYEIYNTDGHTDKEYEKMETLIEKMNQLSKKKKENYESTD